MCSNTDHHPAAAAAAANQDGAKTTEKKKTMTKKTTKRSSKDDDHSNTASSSYSSSSNQSRDGYTVSLSFGFVMAIIMISTLASFHAGKLVRHQMILAVEDSSSNVSSTKSEIMTRWLLWVAEQSAPQGTPERIPEMDTGAAKDTEWIHCRDQKHKDDRFCNIQASQAEATEDSSSSSDDDSAESSEDESDESSDDESSDSDEDQDDVNVGEEADASGNLAARHLLVDLKHNQQPQAVLEDLIKLASSRGWKLQSYQQSPQAGTTLIFEEGHVMILHVNANALDIYSMEKEKTLLSWLSHSTLVNTNIHIDRWAYKPRGTSWEQIDAGLNDMYNGLLGSFEYTNKTLVAREKSPFQEISFYDIIDPRLLSLDAYQKSLSTTEDNYYTRNAHLFQPVRGMYLDGVVQSMSYGERAYHEALVHPSMMLHPKPQRVAIIGAGEGATLREVLKHSCVKEVIMIEIDSAVMDLSRKHLPAWNDCSDFKLPEGMPPNPTGNCFDDPRAKVYAEDAIRWFVDRYGDNDKHDGSHELFDLIIMDALDPGDKVEFSDMLFDNSKLAETFFRALTPDGIFLSQTGEEEDLDDPNPLWTSDKHTILFQRNLAKVGFSRIYGYEEASTRFSGIWSFLLASKSSDTSRWNANPAEIDLELQQRAMPTISGDWPFHYFDGATMQTYQTSSRPVATVTCRTYPDWPACQRGPGLGESTHVAVNDALAVQDNGQVIAKQDIEPGTIVGLEECVEGTWHIPHNTNDLIGSFAASSYPQWNAWKTLSSEFSIPVDIYGEHAIDVDLSNFVLMQQCPAKNSGLEPFAKGETNEMYINFWRIHSCAARRASKQKIEAGEEVSCDGYLETL